jgi:tetratricopeptide (TPR) repeat protein
MRFDLAHIDQFYFFAFSFVKISMACPMECYQPSIPSLLGFGHNLTVHETSIRPFLDSLPLGCRYVFEPAELKNRLSNQAYEVGKRAFRRHIVLATAMKDAGNAAYARNDPAEAITQYAQAIEDLEKLLLKSISEEEERDRETRTLVAVCWANSSAAKMLEVPGYETNLEDARLHAENAITSDPKYAKGYVESLKMCCKSNHHADGSTDTYAYAMPTNFWATSPRRKMLLFEACA